MSDTRRKNSKSLESDSIKYPNLYGWWDPRKWGMIKKGADGNNYKDNYWRYETARDDGSGKLDTFNEHGANDRNMTKMKRQASKDTRRYGKRNMRKELDDLQPFLFSQETKMIFAINTIIGILIMLWDDVKPTDKFIYHRNQSLGLKDKARAF